ncbi:hypothetical protein QBC44DRAFT_304361 [Cladorrhinum sp. PSN332]|nr:hypothetical protein QBC44DRAFT_304361 [Cladorrhinum sp. PSN332]
MPYQSFALSPPASLVIEVDPFEYICGPLLNPVSSGSNKRVRFDSSNSSSNASSNANSTDEPTPASGETSTTGGGSSDDFAIDDDDDDDDDDYYYGSDDAFIDEFQFVRRRVSPVARKSLITEGLSANNNNNNNNKQQKTGNRTVVRAVTPPNTRDRERGMEIQLEREKVMKQARRENRKSGKYAPLSRGANPQQAETQWVCCTCSVLNSGHEWHCPSCKCHGKCEGCEEAVEEIDGDLGLGM